MVIFHSYVSSPEGIFLAEQKKCLIAPTCGKTTFFSPQVLTWSKAWTPSSDTSSEMFPGEVLNKNDVTGTLLSQNSFSSELLVAGSNLWVCRSFTPVFSSVSLQIFFSSFPNFRMLNLEKQLAVDKKLLPRNVLRVLRVAGKLKLGKKERPSLHPMPWRRAVISSRHGNLTPAMRLSSEAMYPAWLWLTVRHGLSMAHRNRWFTELKNDDFPCLC